MMESSAWKDLPLGEIIEMTLFPFSDMAETAEMSNAWHNLSSPVSSVTSSCIASPVPSIASNSQNYDMETHALHTTVCSPIAKPMCSMTSNVVASPVCSMPSNAVVNPVHGMPSNAVVSPVHGMTSNAVASPVCSMTSNAVVSPVHGIPSNGVASPVCSMTSNAVVNPVHGMTSNAVVSPVCSMTYNAVVSPVHGMTSNAVVRPVCSMTSNVVSIPGPVPSPMTIPACNAVTSPNHSLSIESEESLQFALSSLGRYIRDDLREKIHCQRRCKGQVEITPDFDDHDRPCELSAVDVIRRDSRKEQNRRASRKYRLKQRCKTTQLHEELSSEGSLNVVLRHEVKDLYDEVQRLSCILRTHLPQCVNVRQNTAPADCSGPTGSPHDVTFNITPGGDTICPALPGSLTRDDDDAVCPHQALPGSFTREDDDANANI